VTGQSWCRSLGNYAVAAPALPAPGGAGPHRHASAHPGWQAAGPGHRKGVRPRSNVLACLLHALRAKPGLRLRS
jgi:hypothetical protein